MKFPRYPKYRNSGAKWLGDVPEHWGIGALKYYTRSSGIKTGPFGSQLVSAEMEAGEFKVYNQRSVIDGDFESGDEYISAEKFAALSSFETIPGDVLVTTRGTIGRAAILPADAERGILHPCLLRIRVDPSHLKAEFLRLLIADSDLLRTQLAYLSNATTIEVIYSYTMAATVIPNPPLAEQSNILSFLNRETAKIDALIAEQERLIELLNEKRQALISHAVTKGLNPDAPMKDSGIEWLGKVPRHWAVFPMKRDIQFITSGSRGWAENYADDGALFIRIGNLTRQGICLDLSDIQRVQVPADSEGARTLVREGDLLFSITAYLGSIAVVPADLEKAYVSQHVALVRLRGRKFISSWIAYQTLSFVGKTYLETQGYGGTKIQLSLDDVKNLILTAPPLEEQQKIVEFIAEREAKHCSLIKSANESIKLLRERRSALISAAVTGKIDVRGLVPSTAKMEAA